MAEQAIRLTRAQAIRVTRHKALPKRNQSFASFRQTAEESNLARIEKRLPASNHGNNAGVLTAILCFHSRTNGKLLWQCHKCLLGLSAIFPFIFRPTFGGNTAEPIGKLQSASCARRPIACHEIYSTPGHVSAAACRAGRCWLRACSRLPNRGDQGATERRRVWIRCVRGAGVRGVGVILPPCTFYSEATMRGRDVYPVKYYGKAGFVEHKIELDEADLAEIIEEYLSRHADFDFDEVEIVNNRPMNIGL